MAENVENGKEETTKGEQEQKKEETKEQNGVDYEKIQQMINAALQKNDDKAQNQQTSDAADDNVLVHMQEMLQKTQIENAAILEAVGLGIDAKTIPYVLKMADFSSAVDGKGNISKDNIKIVLNKVMEDVPGLKAQIQQQSSGFRVGMAGTNSQTVTDDALKAAFGL